MDEKVREMVMAELRKLTVEVSDSWDYCDDNKYTYLTVVLKYGDEVLSSDTLLLRITNG